jgi:hypothetical protein
MMLSFTFEIFNEILSLIIQPQWLILGASERCSTLVSTYLTHIYQTRQEVRHRYE